MTANGRLTAPPQLEAVLVTNSECGMSRHGASGFSLDISSQLGSLLSQTNAKAALVRASVRRWLRGVEPVATATQELSATLGVAALA